MRKDVRNVRWYLLAGGLAAFLQIGFQPYASAQQTGLDDKTHYKVIEALKGKTVAYLPITLNADLTRGWLDGLKKGLEPSGVNIVVRDYNWDANAGAQALSTLITSNPKPAAIVVHNPEPANFRQADSAGGG
jgi:ribose transport system substrate-binding protein